MVSLLSLGLIIAWQAVMKRKMSLPAEAGVLPRVSGSLALIPGSIVALVAATLLVSITGLNVETIGSRFGGIPQGLPELTVPSFSWEEMKGLFLPAMTLAVLGAIESLLCARVADSMIRDKHDSNQELLAQGFANMVVPFFGGMPATGTIARTVTNIKNGGNSPVAGMVHALCLLVVVLAAAPLAQYIPLPALSAILMFVAWNMGEWREFVLFGYSFFKNVLHLNSSYQKSISDKRPVAPPGKGFSTHNNQIVFGTHFDKRLQARLEFIRLHIVRITSERGIMPTQIQ